MRLVIYTSTNAERLKIETSVAPFEYRSSTQRTFQEDLNWFHSVDNGILILNIEAAATGWRAPKGTIILFTGLIKDGPHKIQAMMRAEHPDAT
jgi:hypothetical protein